jgi:hypothetical protein
MAILAGLVIAAMVRQQERAVVTFALRLGAALWSILLVAVAWGNYQRSVRFNEELRRGRRYAREDVVGVIDDDRGVIGMRAHQFLLNVAPDLSTYGDQFLDEDEYVTYLTWPSDDAVIAMLQRHDIGWVLIHANRDLELEDQRRSDRPRSGRASRVSSTVLKAAIASPMMPRRPSSGFHREPLLGPLGGAGGFVQAASQVALSSREGVMPAALRLPVFSAFAVVAAATLSSGLVFDTDLPGWARMLAGLGLSTVVLLDRRVLQGALRIARRAIRRLPEPDLIPAQPAIIRCYGALLANELAYGLAFALPLGDISDVPLATSMAAFCGGWVLGYLALPLPSGLGVHKAVLVAALPGVGGSILAASLAHRLIGFVAEASLATTAQLRALTGRSGPAVPTHDRQ